MHPFRSLAKIAAIVACSVALVAVGYFYRGIFAPVFSPIVEKVASLTGLARACSEPMTFSVGTVDQRFGMSRAEFQREIEAAAKLWDDAAGRELFRYSDSGKVEINLIYDYRQKATTDLQYIGTSIKEKAASYDALRTRYDAIVADYSKKKAALDLLTSRYESERSSYEQKVSYWQSQGGAPKSAFAELEQERLSINSMAANLNSGRDELNSLGARANSLASTLNQLARDLNLKVKDYNTVGASAGAEFDEGEYIRDSSGTYINIYQYESDAKLQRVLAHELGHALGMDHVEDPKSVMYRLNQSTNLKPTEADMQSLIAACPILAE